MKRKVVMCLMIGAMSVSMLAGCGSDKEVTKVDDNTVQITDVSTEADNGTESTEVETEVVEEVSRDIVEELGIEVIEGSFLPEMDFIAGVVENGEYTDETKTKTATVSISSTEYVAAADSADVDHPEGNATEYNSAYGDISTEPSKEGYVKTYFKVQIGNEWNIVYGYNWTVYDRLTGIHLKPTKTSYGTEGGEDTQVVTVIDADGTEYDCTYEEYVHSDDLGCVYIVMAIEHPAEYDSNNILFVIGSSTAKSVEYADSLEDDDSVSDLENELELCKLRNATFYAYPKASN